MRRHTTTSPTQGNMRNGLISLLTVVVVISLATAAMLTISTSHALTALAQRQAQMTAQGYATERSGQAFVAGVDAVLYEARENGLKRNEAITQISDAINNILVSACTEDVTATFEMEKNGPHVTFSSADGRSLEVELSVDNSLTYRITSWKLTAQVQEDNSQDVLWTPSGADE